MIGLLTTGSRGLGWLAVMGRSRVPSPPAITTAFTGATPSRWVRRSWSGFRSLQFAGAVPGPYEPLDLGGVERRRPPVQAGPPQRERPSDDLRDRGPRPLVGTQEQKREGVQQTEG